MIGRKDYLKKRYKNEIDSRLLLIMGVISVYSVILGVFIYYWVNSLAALLSGVTLGILIFLFFYLIEYYQKPIEIEIDDNGIIFSFRSGKQRNISWSQIEAIRLPSIGSGRDRETGIKIIKSIVWIPISRDAAITIIREFKENSGKSPTIYGGGKAWFHKANQVDDK